MGGPSLLRAPLLPRRSGATADPHSGASRARINPACTAKPANAKKPKRPGSFRDGEPPAKRVRGVCSDRKPNLAAAAAKIKNKKRPCSTPSCLKDSKSSAIKNQVTTLQIQLPEVVKPQPQSKPSISSSSSISELIEKARLAKARPSTAEAEPLDPREIERRRTAALRELEQMVATVEFNDPFIDPLDVTRSRQELIQAREQAWRAQLLAVARPPPAVARPPAAAAMAQADIERCRAEPKQGVVYTLILT